MSHAEMSSSKFVRPANSAFMFVTRLTSHVFIFPYRRSAAALSSKTNRPPALSSPDTAMCCFSASLVLSFSQNSIVVSGARALAEALALYDGLRALRLGWNKIGHEGATASFAWGAAGGFGFAFGFSFHGFTYAGTRRWSLRRR